MRLTILMSLLLAAGCGTNSAFAGKHSKNGGPVRIERLGTATTTDLVDDRSCETQQILWCDRRSASARCDCVYERQVADRVRRMTGQLEPMRVPD